MAVSLQAPASKPVVIQAIGASNTPDRRVWRKTVALSPRQSSRRSLAGGGLQYTTPGLLIRDYPLTRIRQDTRDQHIQPDHALSLRPLTLSTSAIEGTSTCKSEPSPCHVQTRPTSRVRQR